MTDTPKQKPNVTRTPATKRAKYRKEFFARKIKIDDTFERMLRVLDEHVRRHEVHMTDGMHYKNYDQKDNYKISTWHADDAKAAGDLAAKINQVGQMYLKVRAEARREAGNLSLQDEIRLAVQFIVDLTPANRKLALELIDEQLGIPT